MRHFLGRALFILGILILWPLQIGLFVFAIYYVVKAFLDAGVIAGLISILIAGLCLWGIHMLLGVVSIPLAALAARLLEEKTTKIKSPYDEIRDRYEEEWQRGNLEEKGELQWRSNQWYEFMEEGLSPEEADQCARQLNWDSWVNEKLAGLYEHLKRAYIDQGMTAEQAEMKAQRDKEELAQKEKIDYQELPRRVDDAINRVKKGKEDK